MMKEKNLKKATSLRKQTLVCAVAVWVFTTLILIKKSGGLIEFVFISIGAMVLTLVYLKMYAFIKKLEKKPRIEIDEQDI